MSNNNTNIGKFLIILSFNLWKYLLTSPFPQNNMMFREINALWVTLNPYFRYKYIFKSKKNHLLLKF